MTKAYDEQMQAAPYDGLRHMTNKCRQNKNSIKISKTVSKPDKLWAMKTKWIFSGPHLILNGVCQQWNPEMKSGFNSDLNE